MRRLISYVSESLIQREVKLGVIGLLSVVWPKARAKNTSEQASVVGGRQ